ncbi:GNAT family N-acetyltransferase [Francisella frigiditurris]|uniref:Acetyltransferase domain protein n=1 Tax=Francisella frigiditurris TaxID=1542390 RepID=A0A1J0KTD5_9GAMM|nr:N-acetyltransferase [Francisella frigiditurris]APC96955.1 acetyltransferase domain protein [Francisella frigiditurris]
MNIIIRNEKLKDQEEIYKVIAQAFDSDDEVKLVRLLHARHHGVISLVAELGGRVVGHIILSEMSCDDVDNIKIFGLGPMAVLPEYQHKGIGTKLVKSVIQSAKDSKIDAIFVLGHHNYYPKFGFHSTDEYKILSEYDVPAEVFMVFDITNKLKILENKTVKYAEEFSKVF